MQKENIEMISHDWMPDTAAERINVETYACALLQASQVYYLSYFAFNHICRCVQGNSVRNATLTKLTNFIRIEIKKQHKQLKRHKRIYVFAACIWTYTRK